MGASDRRLQVEWRSDGLEGSAAAANFRNIQWASCATRNEVTYIIGLQCTLLNFETIYLLRWKLAYLLSGVPDFFDRNKILSGGDLSHYQVPHCIRVFFYFVWFVFIHHNFQFYLNYVPIITFWIFTYHKIWILLIVFCFIWNYWIIYFFNMFGSVLECCELTGVSLLWPWLIKWK